MMLSIVEATGVIRTQAKTLADANSVLIHLPNQNFTIPQPKSGVLWTILDIQPGDSTQLEIGTSRDRTVGIAVHRIFSDVLVGDAAAYAYANKVKRLFSGATIDGVRFLTSRINTVGTEGSWWRVNVSSTFQFDDDLEA